MYLDLTPEISLDAKNLRRYRRLRLLLYTSSFLLAGYLAFHILFPSLFFEFSFNNPKAKSNTVIDPRKEDGSPLEKGALPAGKNAFFNTSLIGNYSTALTSFTLDKKSATFSAPEVSVQKSYAAFLYPEGDPLGFRNGTLLKNKADYYIISHGKLKKFTDSATIDALGFPRNGFVIAEDSELQYNPPGQDIKKETGYPEDTLFHIQDDYYALQNNTLKKFVSEAAFFTYYKKNQTIEKPAEFLGKYAATDEPIGFAEGSLLSYADTIYVVTDNSVFPIDSPITFTGKGFDWNDVVPVSADEIALYKKENLFTIANDHPNGTIFTTTEDQRHYLIADQKKHLLPGDSIFASWINTTPIPVSQKSLAITSSCRPKKALFKLNAFECAIPIAAMQNLIGSDYIFSLQPDTKIILDSIQVEFKKDVGVGNLRFTLSELINRIKNNYAP